MIYEKQNDGIRSTDIGLFLIRAVLAAVFIYHGSQKLFGSFGGPGIAGATGFFTALGIPAPKLSVYLAAGTEFFGAILLMIGGGILGRIVAAIMAFNMAVAIILVHRDAFGSQNKGMEFPLTLGVVLLALVFTGLGRLTLPNLFFGGKREKPAPEGFEIAR